MSGSQTRTVREENFPSSFPSNFSVGQSEKRLNGCVAAREINQLRLATLPPDQKVGRFESWGARQILCNQ